MRQSRIAHGGGDDSAGIGGRADVGSTRIQGCGPHLFVGDTVSADDAEIGKFTVQTLYVSQSGSLHIDDHDVGAEARDEVAEFGERAHDVDGMEVMAELSGEEAGDSGVLLQEGETKQLHTTPNERAVVWRRAGLRLVRRQQ